MKTVSPHTLNLISNYTANTISEIEFYELKQWLLEDSENKAYFIEHLKNHKNSRSAQFLKILDKEMAWNTILSKLQHPLPQSHKTKNPEVKKLKITRTILKYAAVAVLLISAGYFYTNGFLASPQQDIIPSEHITLQLENGDIQIINEAGARKIVDVKGNEIGTQKGNQMVYSTTNEKETLAYNTLTVPYGKRFEIQLSDGTTVHLNSGSALKFPITFLNGKKREVFLTGEAFFSVTKDASHPFIVNAAHLNVEVLGTEFNISAYPEDTTTDVVLVEGSVGMYQDAETLKNATMLVPSTKGTYNKKGLRITTEKVNTHIYTSWMQGGLFFRNMSFKNIVKKLERHYNKKIIITNDSLNDEIFNANFNDEPLEKILSYFNDSYHIKYKIENNIIYIN